MVEIRGQYELKDYLQAYKLHQRGSIFLWVPVWILVIMLLLALLSDADPLDLLLGQILPIAVAAGALIFLQRVVVPKSTARQLREMKDATSPMEVRLDEEGWHFKNDFGNYHLPWNTFPKWKEDASVLVLYRSNRVFQIIPKRMLEKPSDLDYIRERLKLAGVPERAWRSARQLNIVITVLLGLAGLGIVALAMANEYRQRRDPIPADAWVTREAPDVVSFRMPGPTTYDLISEEELTAMSLGNDKPSIRSWTARREGLRFNLRVVEYSLETVLEFDDLELAYEDAAARAGDIEGYEEILHDDRDGIRIDAKDPNSITEAYIDGRRLFIANTDWPVETDRRTFFESIQILTDADPNP